MYLCVMISGILFLTKKDKVWDHRGLAFAEVGTLFMFLVLTTGPIWAKPAWGIFWPWEPRLTTSLVLFLIFLGYFMLRGFGGNPEQVSRYAAVIRSEEHTSELQSQAYIVCRLLLEKKNH
mgnify:CR=1 FL=1